MLRGIKIKTKMTKELYKIKQFTIEGIEQNKFPKGVELKIRNNFIEPFRMIYYNTGIRPYPSRKSCYRSKEWELSKGRSGLSQHVFIGEGACDVSCKDFRNKKQELIDAFVKYTNVKRIAVYGTFIHVDYKPTIGHKTVLYKSNSKSEWTFVKILK